MYTQYINKSKKNYIQKLCDKLLHKLYILFYVYFNCSDTILLNKIEKYQYWEIGDYTYGSFNGSPQIIYFQEKNAQLKIGKFCSFAEEVTILLGGYHRTDWITTYPFNALFEKAGHIKGHPYSKGDIVMGNDVWICRGATILSGVKIGNGAVIAAESVVTKDVPPYAIVAGNPAKVVRKRFSDDIIEKLEKIQWWNWSIEKIQEEFEGLLSSNIEFFVNKHLVN